MEIIIEAGAITADAELNDSPTARAVYEALPIEATALTWGDEIYFEIPVDRALDETARELVEDGDLGYWPTGRALCIFFGPTPASGPGEIRPASAVNVIGRVKGDTGRFRSVPAGTAVRIGRKS